MNSDGLDRLDVPHRRLVAFQKTETARELAVSESLNLLSMFFFHCVGSSLNPLAASVEMLLLLIWRHIDHYSNPPVKEEPDVGTPVSSTPTKGAWGGFFSPWKSTTKGAASPSKNAWETPAGSHNQQQSWLAAQAFRRDIKGALKPVLSYLDDLQLVRVRPSSVISRLLTLIWSLTMYPNWTHEQERRTLRRSIAGSEILLQTQPKRGKQMTK